MSVDLQIVMPVHNEAGLIGTTLKEWLDDDCLICIYAHELRRLIEALQGKMNGA